MNLFVGLGNYETKYKKTRHNVGFWLLDELADRLGWEWKKNKLYLVASGELNGHQTALIKPTTFMNMSGLAVKEALLKYNLLTENLILFYDDLYVPVGSMRIRQGGSSGGHNGVKSIIENISDSECWRFKIGIGPIADEADYSDFVLSKFKASEEKQVRSVIDILVERMLAFSGQLITLEEETVHVS